MIEGAAGDPKLPVPGEHASEDFTYTEDEWTLIAAEIGDDLQRRVDLEAHVQRWLAQPNNQDLRRQSSADGKIAKAALDLAIALETAGIDYEVIDHPLNSRSLVEFVANIGYQHEDLADQLQEEHGRERLQDGLCWFWRVKLEKEVGASVDPITGKEGGPMVRFLVAACSPVLSSPFRPSAARHAIRKFQEHMRANGDPLALAKVDAAERAAERDQDRKYLNSLLDSRRDGLGSNGEVDPGA